MKRKAKFRAGQVVMIYGHETPFIISHRFGDYWICGPGEAWFKESIMRPLNAKERGTKSQ